MRNKYLEILELEPGATKDDVKKAYRRLSKVYHPDISKNENAKDKFIEINEAYNFLTQVGPAPHQESVNYDYDPEVDEFYRRREEARARAKRRAKEEARLQEEIIKKMLRVFDWAAIMIIGFNIILALDYFLPRQSIPQTIISVSEIYETSGRSSKHRYDHIEFEDFEMRFDKNELVGLDPDADAEVITTILLKNPVAAIITINGKKGRHYEIYGIYAVFGYIIPMVLISIVLYKYVMRTLDHKLTLAIFMVVLFLIQFFLFV